MNNIIHVDFVGNVAIGDEIEIPAPGFENSKWKVVALDDSGFYHVEHIIT